MTFHMDKKKNLFVLIAMICLLVFVLVFSHSQLAKELFASRYFIHYFCISYLSYGTFLIILDFKKVVTVDETGFYMYSRRRQYDLDWKQIRRLEYSGKKWAPAFNTMVIHTSTGKKLYVDYTFKDYKKAWLCIAQHYQTYGEQPIIDKEIWEISEEEST